VGTEKAGYVHSVGALGKRVISGTGEKSGEGEVPSLDEHQGGAFLPLFKKVYFRQELKVKGSVRVGMGEAF